MKMKELLKESYITALERMGKAWWIKIKTEQPLCTYYFGPFSNPKEAAEAQPNYLEDLETEQAQGISWNIEQSKPLELTLY